MRRCQQNKLSEHMNMVTSPALVLTTPIRSYKFYKFVNVTTCDYKNIFEMLLQINVLNVNQQQNFFRVTVM